MTKRITIRETFGLSPLPLRAKEAWMALRGDPSVPPSRFGVSSLKIFKPRLSIKTWLGWRPRDRRIPILNLFNHTQTPLEEGWSVRKTQVRDFRGGTLTYDSHNGTDFTIPVGTVVVAAAGGRVLRVSSEFNRGGLKVFIDHGRGLVTTSNHLARALVEPGDRVERGTPIALSGYSGLDGLAAFPWSAPHVHFNVWLNGDYVDPFALPGEIPLWRSGNDPAPFDGAEHGPEEPTAWDPALVDAAVAACVEPEVRAALEGEEDLGFRAMNVMFQRNYYPTRFSSRPPLYETEHTREPWLDLPFRAEDYEGISFAFDDR